MEESNQLPTLQELLERDADKIKEIKRARHNSKIEPEFLLLAEFGKFFGWQAVESVMKDDISFEKMNKLLAAARHMDSIERYNRVMDLYAATISPHDKGKALKQTIKGIRDTWQQ